MDNLRNTGNLPIYASWSANDKRPNKVEVLKCVNRTCTYLSVNHKSYTLRLVTELSTPTFIMAFRGFIFEIGIPSHVFSDNGTNCFGVNTEHKKLHSSIQKKNSVSKLLSSYNTDAFFIQLNTT